MEALDRLVAELFTAHGYKVTQDAALEGRTGAVYGAPVLAENDRGAMVIERRGPADTITATEVEEFVRVIQDTGAYHGVLIHLGAVEPGAAERGEGVITMWGRDTVARLVGAALLHEAAATPLGPLPLAWDLPSMAAETVHGEPMATGGPTVPGGSLDDLLPAAFHLDSDFDVPDEVLPFDLEVFESLADEAPMTYPAPVWESPAMTGPDPFTAAFEAPELAAGPEPSPQSPPPSATAYPPLHPRVSADEAAAIVRDRLFAVARAELVLQPVHLIDYECDLLIEGSLRYDTLRGRLEVHGTRKTVREVDPFHLDPAKAHPLPPQAGQAIEEKTLRITPQRALELVRDHLMITHTRIVEIETADAENDVSVMERKRVAPRPDQLRMEVLGIVERPLWRMRGPNGAILVDGLTGEVAEEELRTYDPDVVIVD